MSSHLHFTKSEDMTWAKCQLHTENILLMYFFMTYHDMSVNMSCKHIMVPKSQLCIFVVSLLLFFEIADMFFISYIYSWFQVWFRMRTSKRWHFLELWIQCRMPEGCSPVTFCLFKVCVATFVFHRDGWMKAPLRTIHSISILVWTISFCVLCYHKVPLEKNWDTQQFTGSQLMFCTLAKWSTSRWRWMSWWRNLSWWRVL